MRYVLNHFDYADKDVELVGRPDPKIVGTAANVLSDEINGF
jgi:hypothetical protein